MFSTGCITVAFRPTLWCVWPVTATEELDISSATVRRPDKIKISSKFPFLDWFWTGFWLQRAVWVFGRLCDLWQIDPTLLFRWSCDLWPKSWLKSYSSLNLQWYFAKVTFTFSQFEVPSIPGPGSATAIVIGALWCCSLSHQIVVENFFWIYTFKMQDFKVSQSK